MTGLSRYAVAAAIAVGFVFSAKAEPLIVPLSNDAGRHVGYVSVDNTKTELLVTYKVTDEGWRLIETYLAVGAGEACSKLGAAALGQGRFISKSYDPAENIREATINVALDEVVGAGTQADAEICIDTSAHVAADEAADLRI